MSSGMVHVTDVSGALDRANRLLAGIDQGVWKAAHSAIKRAAKRGKTESGRFASSVYNITKGTFMAKTKVKTKLSGGIGGVASAEIRFNGGVIPLIEFGAKFTRAGDVSVSVKRGGGGNLAHAFIANIGGISVYERVGKPRFPVEKKYGPSGPQMMENGEVENQMEQLIANTFAERMEHEIARVLNGW